MVVVPTRRDEIFQLLADGRADVAAGLLTVTAERARLVDFSQPFASEVNEVVITGPDTPAGTGFDAPGGHALSVRPSSSRFHHLAAPNGAGGSEGVEALRGRAAEWQRRSARRRERCA